MSDLLSELRQYALMTANEIKHLQLDSDVATSAYQRAANYPPQPNTTPCPVCWVKNEIITPLVRESWSDNNVATFKCGICGFGAALPDNNSAP